MSDPGLGDVVSLGRCVTCRRPGPYLCARCERRAAAPPRDPVAALDRLIAAWSYDEPARSLVLRLKVTGDRGAAGPLVEAMWRAALRAGVAGAVVTWVPGKPAETRRRGFDHAELLARGLASRLGLPARALLVRAGSRPDQTTLGRAERRRNLAGAFAATTPCPRAVVLVDDLVTTGATAAECSSALHGAGAAIVEVVAACRA